MQVFPYSFPISYLVGMIINGRMFGHFYFRGACANDLFSDCRCQDFTLISNLTFDRVYIVGLRSHFIFKCEYCQEEATLHTDIPVKSQKDEKSNSSDITQKQKAELPNKRSISLKQERSDWVRRGLHRKRKQKESGSRNINKKL